MKEREGVREEGKKTDISDFTQRDAGQNI